jgi:putative SOS response-associated peptidase YedK
LAHDERAQPEVDTVAYLGAEPFKRCRVPLTEFCEWTPDKHQVGETSRLEQPVFAVAGFRQETVKRPAFTMMICDLNDLIAPIHPPESNDTILHETDWN